MKLRHPSVSGAFYSATPESLKNQIRGCFLSKLGPNLLPPADKKGPRSIVAAVCPHAGYMYSGPTAAHSYYNLAADGKPKRIVIIGPNHTGMGSPVSLMSEGSWKTPLGSVSVDRELALRILQKSKTIDDNEEAHLMEHSVEVQLPFLQFIYGDFDFVPLCMMLQDLRTSVDVGKSIGEACAGEDVVIIASSDFTHYEPQEKAAHKDRLAIDAILELDPEKLLTTVRDQNITMCGAGPIASALIAAKKLGAKSARLASYSTSGDVVGDYGAVVGYASIILLRNT